MTMAYQDLIRKGRNGKLICMSRVGASRHQRTITVVNIRTLVTMAQEQAAAPLSYRDGEIRPVEVTARLVNRALMFHRVITSFSRQEIGRTLWMYVPPTRAYTLQRERDLQRR